MATVLVVDDEPSVRRMIAAVLEQQGYFVLIADSGSHALSVSRAYHGEIDLLVSDVVMPLMDGPALARDLTRERPGLPVLLVSGYCDAAQIDRCRPFPLLPKPFCISSLVATVHSLMNEPAVEPAVRAAAARVNAEYPR